jgi:hypothetical protein
MNSLRMGAFYYEPEILTTRDLPRHWTTFNKLSPTVLFGKIQEE